MKITPTITEYEVTDLPTLGFITITDIGEENVYFTLSDGTAGYCKIIGYENPISN